MFPIATAAGPPALDFFLALFFRKKSKESLDSSLGSKRQGMRDPVPPLDCGGLWARAERGWSADRFSTGEGQRAARY